MSSPNANAGSGSGPTLLDLFKQLGLIAWFALTPTQPFGVNGELGNDFGMPANSPVGAGYPGKVVAVWQDPSGSSIGTIVQVEDSHGDVWHYQHLRSAAVKVGDTVPAGGVVGYSGGCPTGCYSKNTSRCNCYDRFSTNPHIEVRYAPHYDPQKGMWNQDWQNPAPIFTALAKWHPQAPQYQPGGGQGGTCKHSIQWSSPSVLGQGGGTTTICMDPAIDFAARAGLLLFALVLVIMAIYLFTHPGASVQDAGQQVTSKIQSAKKLADVASLAL